MSDGPLADEQVILRALRMNRAFTWIFALVGAVIVMIVAALNLEEATEFSPDLLRFRDALYVGDVRVVATREWSTPLLDEARAKNPVGQQPGAIRWRYVHGKNVVGRPSFANGDAKSAFRFYRSGRWDDVLLDPRNKRDEIIKQVVDLMRQEKYGDAAEFLYNRRFAQK